MPHEHEGMKLWVEPDKHLASGTMEQGSDVHLTVGVEPADASNRVQVRYRVNGGPSTAIDAEPLRHVGRAQFFKARLPSATLRDGDTLEYGAVCQCAGRQVPSTHEVEQFSSSLRVMNGKLVGGESPPVGTLSLSVGARPKTGLTEARVVNGKLVEAQPAISNTRSAESAPVKTMSASVGGRTNTVSGNANQLKPTHLSLFVLVRSSGHPIARMPFYAEVGVIGLSNPLKHDVPLTDTNTQEQRIAWAHPLGVLATDHVGYLSFDLTRLPPDVADALALALEMRRRDPNTPTHTSIWIYPMAREESRIDALAQIRFAHDAIVVKVELDMELDSDLCQPKMCESIKNLGFMTMQNPDLTDWRLSPGSFATNPGALIGADGCEMVVPSNIALHEFNFHQVIGVSAADVELPIDDADAAAKVRPGFVNEYRLSFIPIGHALGQILYSFPLAPGESVNFAVIDWTRRDSALRNEASKLNESLVHELRRDRIISETVRASIDEWQHGGSLMAGLGASLGGAMGGGGMGLAAGASAALGGAYSTTSGSRDIAADTVQKLSDNVSQAATSSRELHSTVVVQSSQAEHEAIETRTVVNYNHSHALTILYYEVLRHFRVVTEFVRRRPALLTNIHGGIAHRFAPSRGRHWNYKIDWPTIYENRKLLEAALLDDRYREGFDIAERRRHRDFVAEVVGPPPAPTPAPNPPLAAGPELRYFVVEMKTGGWFADDRSKDVKVNVTLFPKNIRLDGGGGGGEDAWRVSPPGAFTLADAYNSFVGHLPMRNTIRWGDIDMIQILVWQSGTDVSFQHIKVTAIDVDGHALELVDKHYEFGHLTLTNDFNIDLPTFRPQPPPPPPGRSAESIEEEAKFLEFNEHLLNHRAHYERALRLGSTPAQRAFELASLGVGGDASLLEKVDNRPLEVLGDYVAYPCIDPVWSERIMAKAKKPPRSRGNRTAGHTADAWCVRRGKARSL